jgi:hypothetical protein
MADLLECLIQIKGVADTPRRFRLAWAVFCSRVGGVVATPVGLAVFGAMLERELVYQVSLNSMLAEHQPLVPRIEAAPIEVEMGVVPAAANDARAIDDVLADVERFATARAATAAVLEGCSADELNRTGVDPRRGVTSVADLVALMLAHDTDQLAAFAADARDVCGMANSVPRAEATGAEQARTRPQPGAPSADKAEVRPVGGRPGNAR